MKTLIGICFLAYIATATTKFLLAKGKVIQNIGVLSPYYDISFDIRPFHRYSGWRNVIHFTTGGDVGKYGDRTPAVFFWSGSTRMHICSAISGNGNYCWNSHQLPLYKYSRIRIQQYASGEKVYFRVLINGIQRFIVENTTPRSFKNVKVYAGDKWYQHAIAFMKNYKLLNIQPALVLQKGKLIQIVSVLPRYYDLKFDVKPFAKVTGWSSIIHLTTGGDIGKYGDRTPAVFFWSGTTRLHICSAISGNRNYCWNSPFELSLNVFSSIRIQQFPHNGKVFFRVSVHGLQRFIVENTKPQSFRIVQVYAADKWYQPAQAKIVNYKLA